MNEIEKKVAQRLSGGVIPQKALHIITTFVSSYTKMALKGGAKPSEIQRLFDLYLEKLLYLHQNPFHFKPYHKQVLEPFDFYQFGLDFVRPLVDEKKSEYLGDDNLNEINQGVARGENVILLANHQTEMDPQLISLLIEEKYSKLAKEMIFVAGDRVICDHLAVPFSMGRNLLCIYSKKHIHNPPEKMEEKRLHNKKTMQLMGELLKEGGKCIYVAPSGGRDRPNSKGEFEVSEFDPQSIEMFYLMTKKSQTKAHFYPLTLLTYPILPPPNDVETELGESRSTEFAGIYASFAPEIDMDHFKGAHQENKVKQRHARCDFIMEVVRGDYQRLKKLQDRYE